MQFGELGLGLTFSTHHDSKTWVPFIRGGGIAETGGYKWMGRACILLTFIDLQISSLNGQELALTK